MSLQEALRYASLGWQVFPVKAGLKVPYAGFKWRQEATGAADKLHCWFGPDGLYGDAGLAIATGESSGVWVLDLDGLEGMASFHELAKVHGVLSSVMMGTTATATTPRGGRHLLFTMPEGKEIYNSRNKVCASVDTRGTGGYIVAPHSSDKRRAWITPPECTSAAPAWLLDLI